MSISTSRSNWMQHHMPWLAVFSLLFGVSRDETIEADFEGLDG